MWVVHFGHVDTDSVCNDIWIPMCLYIAIYRVPRCPMEFMKCKMNHAMVRSMRRSIGSIFHPKC